ncbi:MAG TPA: pyridoxamine 5'-phosphate oxidase family protein [Yinghuangia sp.]|nr:pyridoxamine 5'-phosphate oxidase family protein [Yinghuangia sp.]
MAGYHSGESAVQRQAGLLRQAAFSLGGIHDSIPDVAAAFLAEQPMIVLGGADARDRMWATQLVGQPGFLRVPDPRTLVIEALPETDDPLHELLTDTGPGGLPARVGMIAIEPATRRRMRINGRVVRERRQLRVAVDQVIANCPKYIQKRERVVPEDRPKGSGPRVVTEDTELNPDQQRAIGAADTFFIATASGDGDADASHRGGNPGFVRVLSPTLLRWPDYTGNAMFLTLGNLVQNPAAGILVPDWDTGTALHLTGTARTVWDTDETAQVPGAQRLVEFTVAAVREITAACDLRWSGPAFSRFNPPVG